MKALVLAGGDGTRLWPLSRRDNPKQLHALFGGRSLLQSTVDRLKRGFAVRDIFICASAERRDQVLSALPDFPPEQFVWEPARRDTAAAIGFGLLRIAQDDPLATFVVINSDAYVSDPDEYLRVIALAGQEAARRQVPAVLIGVPPTYAETGYGYIKTGEHLGRPEGGEETDALFAVERFVEKPDAATAAGYLNHGGYLWNPTLIVGCADRFLALYDKHLPQHAAAFRRLRPLLANACQAAVLAAEFASMPKVSIDYGILEKQPGLLVLPAEFGWADVGNWHAVRDILAGEKSPLKRGRTVEISSSGNLIVVPEGKVAVTIGVDNLAVIETADALLICPLDQVHEVKKAVEFMDKDAELRKFV